MPKLFCNITIPGEYNTNMWTTHENCKTYMVKALKSNTHQIKHFYIGGFPLLTSNSSFGLLFDPYMGVGHCSEG